MRTAIIVWIAVALGLAGCGVNAQDAARRALAEELLNEMNMKETMEQSFAMMKKMMPAQIEQMEKTRPASEQAKTSSSTAKQNTKMMGKMMDAMAQEMSWDKIKEDYITVYAETFTEEELRGLVAFYKSPAGKALVKKQPEIMRRSMELSRKMMAKVMPQIQAMTKEMIESNHRDAKKTPPPVKEAPLVAKPLKDGK
jgi:uncharacterized protein